MNEIRQEMGTACSGKKVGSDASLTPEMENLLLDEIFDTGNSDLHFCSGRTSPLLSTGGGVKNQIKSLSLPSRLPNSFLERENHLLRFGWTF
jgi:hypothetical protein